MAKPQKFRIRMPEIKIVNRCIICGAVIYSGSICASCARKMDFRRKK